MAATRRAGVEKVRSAVNKTAPILYVTSGGWHTTCWRDEDRFPDAVYHPAHVTRTVREASSGVRPTLSTPVCPQLESKQSAQSATPQRRLQSAWRVIRKSTAVQHELWSPAFAEYDVVKAGLAAGGQETRWSRMVTASALLCASQRAGCLTDITDVTPHLNDDECGEGQINAPASIRSASTSLSQRRVGRRAPAESLVASTLYSMSVSACAAAPVPWPPSGQTSLGSRRGLIQLSKRPIADQPAVFGKAPRPAPNKCSRTCSPAMKRQVAASTLPSPVGGGGVFFVHRKVAGRGGAVGELSYPMVRSRPIARLPGFKQIGKPVAQL